MNLTIFGSTSRTGLQLLPQAQQRGHQVTACSRHPERLPNPNELAAVVKGDACELGWSAGRLRGRCGGGDRQRRLRRNPHQAEEVVATVLAGMGEHGVTRFVVTSAYPASAPTVGSRWRSCAASLRFPMPTWGGWSGRFQRARRLDDRAPQPAQRQRIEGAARGEPRAAGEALRHAQG